MMSSGKSLKTNQRPKAWTRLQDKKFIIFFRIKMFRPTDNFTIGFSKVWSRWNNQCLRFNVYCWKFL